MGVYNTSGQVETNRERVLSQALRILIQKAERDAILATHKTHPLEQLEEVDMEFLDQLTSFELKMYNDAKLLSDSEPRNS